MMRFSLAFELDKKNADAICLNPSRPNCLNAFLFAKRNLYHLTAHLFSEFISCFTIIIIKTIVVEVCFLSGSETAIKRTHAAFLRCISIGQWVESLFLLLAVVYLMMRIKQIYRFLFMSIHQSFVPFYIFIFFNFYLSLLFTPMKYSTQSKYIKMNFEYICVFCHLLFAPL